MFVLTDRGSTDRLKELVNGFKDIHYTCHPDWKHRDPLFYQKQFDLALDLSAIDSFLIGSGSDIDFTDFWIRKSKSAKKTSIVFLDSWVNFENRFTESPDYLIVTDPWARDYAQKVFGKTIKLELVKIDRSSQGIKHSGVVKEVLIASTRKNNYTEVVSGLHQDNCVCPDLEKAKRYFPNSIFRVRPHPDLSEACFADYEEDSKVEIVNPNRPLRDQLSQSGILLGPPSYAHYYAESLGVPAFLTRKANNNWHGPLFRYLE